MLDHDSEFKKEVTTIILYILGILYRFFIFGICEGYTVYLLEIIMLICKLYIDIYIVSFVRFRCSAKINYTNKIKYMKRYTLIEIFSIEPRQIIGEDFCSAFHCCITVCVLMILI